MVTIKDQSWKDNIYVLIHLHKVSQVLQERKEEN